MRVYLPHAGPTVLAVLAAQGPLHVDQLSEAPITAHMHSQHGSHDAAHAGARVSAGTDDAMFGQTCP